MDVDRRTNPPEEQISQRQSLSSNYRNCSQYKKVSIGVLVDSLSKADTKDLKEPVMQTAENEAYSKANCVKDCEGHTPLVEKRVAVEQKDTSPWVSTRSCNRKRSSVAVQDTEHTPSFPAISRRRPRSKLLEKASGSHSHKFFAAKSGLESDKCKKISGNDICSVEAGKANDADHVENLVFSTEPGVRLEKEQAEDKNRKIETGGRETLRVKLWEILGSVSSPNKQCPSPKCAKLHPDQERDVKQTPIKKINLNSDTIESDSQPPVFTKPMTRSLTRKKASTKKQSNKTEATKSIRRKECPQKKIFSFRGDWSGRLYDNFNDDSYLSKGSKTERMSSHVETCQGRKHGNAEERLQSGKSRSIQTVENSKVQRNKASNASSSSGKRNDVLLGPKNDTKNNTSPEPPLNVMTDQKDVEQSMHEVSTKDQQGYLSNSPLKNKKNSGHDPSDSPSECKSRGSLPKSKQGKLQEQSLADKIFNRTDIRSFKSLLSSKSAECVPDVQLEASDDRCEPNDIPNNSFLVKPSTVLDDDGVNRKSKLSTDETDSERSEDEAYVQDCRKSEELSPEIFTFENFPQSQNKSLGNDKYVEMTGCNPESNSLKDGIQDNAELEMYLEQNHEDGLARAVALFAVALNRLKTKLKSISSRRSADILQAAVEDIFLRLQNAESLIQTDMGKLTNQSHLKRKQLETRFQEQQDQLLGISKRFKVEVNKHLQNYESLIEDLEEHEIELKRSVEKQKAAHKKVLARVEQEINVQLNGTESRIQAVQELAREKMLQLKVGVAECLKHGAFG